MSEAPPNATRGSQGADETMAAAEPVRRPASLNRDLKRVLMLILCMALSSCCSHSLKPQSADTQKIKTNLLPDRRCWDPSWCNTMTCTPAGNGHYETCISTALACGRPLECDK